MNYKTILIEKKNGFAVLKLNRPGEMNALSKEMRKELDEIFNVFENDAEINSIIITGGEYVFSAGMDIKEMTALPDSEIGEYYESMIKYLKKVYSCKKPVIAAVGGFALGAGFDLALACDLIVASESAIFCHPELKFGANPFFSPLIHIVGVTKAKEIVMLGEPIGANESLKIGLVNRVVSPEKLMEEAENMAAVLAKRSAKAFAELKKLCAIVPRMDKMAALDFEANIGAKLFSRNERKIHMNEVLFLEKIRKEKQN